MNQAPLSPVSALVAHIEPLITERRILVVGSAERSVAEHLLERGARLVQLLDPDPRRVAHAAAHNNERRVTYAPLTDSSLRDGSFDLVLVEDVELGEDLQGLVSGIQRAMSNRGLAVFCARNSESSTGLLGASPGAVDYDTLYDAIEERFESVIMMGQSPFLGYSVVQFGLQGPPEPALDNAYLNQEAEPPDFYIALCGTEEAIDDVELEDMSIVQLSAQRFVSDSETSHRDRERRAARHAESLEQELRTLRDRQNDSQLESLTQELEQRDSWIRELESRGEKANARADDARAELEEIEQELEDTHAALLNTREDADRAVQERDEAIKLLKKTEELHSKGVQEAKKNAAIDPELRRETLEEIDELESELEDTLKLLKKAKKQLKESEARNATLEKRLSQAEKVADEVKHQKTGLEALEGELNALDKKNKSLKEAAAGNQIAFERLEKRLAEQEKEIDVLHEQLDETEESLQRAQNQVSKDDGPSLKEVENDVRRLELQLKERGARISELESQLRNLELYAKTLKAETLTPTEAAAPSASDELDTLAKALAEREADLVAAEWKIGQLKQAASKS